MEYIYKMGQDEHAWSNIYNTSEKSKIDTEINKVNCIDGYNGIPIIPVVINGKWEDVLDSDDFYT